LLAKADDIKTSDEENGNGSCDPTNSSQTEDVIVVKLVSDTLCKGRHQVDGRG
jgi:hypothetical protein